MADIFRKGSKGDAVVAIQEKLQHLGFALEADGHFGDITHNIGNALATRELMSDLRAYGVGGGPPPFGPRDRSRFLEALELAVRTVPVERR